MCSVTNKVLDDFGSIAAQARANGTDCVLTARQLGALVRECRRQRAGLHDVLHESEKFSNALHVIAARLSSQCRVGDTCPFPEYNYCPKQLGQACGTVSMQEWFLFIAAQAPTWKEQA